MKKVSFSAAWAVARDVVLLGLGVWGVVHEELSGRVSPDLLILYGSLLSTPGAIAAVQLLRGKSGIPDTPVQSPSPPQPSPPAPSVQP